LKDELAYVNNVNSLMSETRNVLQNEKVENEKVSEELNMIFDDHK
jgi:hypothetical protein